MEKSTENRIFRAIGLMSGTAMDGIDAALIETDGYGAITRLGFETQPHEDGLRQKLRQCLNRTTISEDENAVARAFTAAQIPVIQRLLKKTGFTAEDIDVIGFHGQTIHHDPDKGLTIQLGDGEWLARETGIDVVYDLRQADMCAGGQGAPLLPVYHRALAMQAGLDFPVAVVNIGGVSNMTWMDADRMIAFDTGPGNAMIDDWVLRHTDTPYDMQGTMAAAGQIDTDKVNEFMAHPYFDKAYPKSLDRNDFADFCLPETMACADGSATLTQITVQAIAKGITLCPQKPSAIYVTGGGRHNDTMMQWLSGATGLAVYSVDTLDWNGDSIEAEGFAYMAVRTLLNAPVSFPTTTGCEKPTVGGVLVCAKKAQAA